MINFYFPRWFFPNNLGDSIVSTFIPKLLNFHFKEDIEVVTHGEDMVEVFKNVPGVVNVRQPYANEIKSIPDWIHFKPDSTNFSVYPEWHPNTWKLWGENFDKFYKHPTANLITLSYLLQLGLESYINTDYDLSPCVIPSKKKPILSDKINIAIVPADKLSGRATPHPGCDGNGYRLNGPRGLKDWRAIVQYLKSNIDCTIYEFSPKFLSIGDKHIPHIKSYVDLATFCRGFDFAVLSDGGMHHIFNSQDVPVYLLGTQKINKPYFFKLKNGIYNESLFNKCMCSKKQNLIGIKGWTDLDSLCNLTCEKVNPIDIAHNITEIIHETRSI